MRRHGSVAFLDVLAGPRDSIAGLGGSAPGSDSSALAVRFRPRRKNKSSTSQSSCACQRGHASHFGNATPTSLKRKFPSTGGELAQRLHRTGGSISNRSAAQRQPALAMTKPKGTSFANRSLARFYTYCSPSKHRPCHGPKPVASRNAQRSAR